jgi:hypothetical protein
MTELTYTLLGDGASDEVLLRHLAWLIEQSLNPGISTRPQWADLRAYRIKPSSLTSRIRAALTLYPCDLLFVHRDAESQHPQDRYDKIIKAIEHSGSQALPVVCVVPVRMQEAWLLFDETAIRQAAGNPNGKVKLSLPSPAAVEAIPDPKFVLYGRLRMASELTGRRLILITTILSEGGLRWHALSPHFPAPQALLPLLLANWFSGQVTPESERHAPARRTTAQFMLR